MSGLSLCGEVSLYHCPLFGAEQFDSYDEAVGPRDLRRHRAEIFGPQSGRAFREKDGFVDGNNLDELPEYLAVNENEYTADERSDPYSRHWEEKRFFAYDRTGGDISYEMSDEEYEERIEMYLVERAERRTFISARLTKANNEVIIVKRWHPVHKMHRDFSIVVRVKNTGAVRETPRKVRGYNVEPIETCTTRPGTIRIAKFRGKNGKSVKVARRSIPRQARTAA